MDEKVKHRMIGAAVFFALAVIFVPMLFEESLKPADQPTLQEVKIPQQPKPFESQIVALDRPESASKPAETVELPVISSPEPVASPVELPVADAITEVVIPAAPVAAPSNETSASKAAANAPGNAWMIQVGSFGSEANAHGLANELQKAGFKAFVEIIQGSNGVPMYRVAVGPESGRQTAEMIRNTLLQKMGMKTLIKPYVQ